jgi:hypothetical protein
MKIGCTSYWLEENLKLSCFYHSVESYTRTDFVAHTDGLTPVNLSP